MWCSLTPPSPAAGHARLAGRAAACTGPVATSWGSRVFLATSACARQSPRQAPRNPVCIPSLVHALAGHGHHRYRAGADPRPP